jgi:hypothetical protein
MGHIGVRGGPPFLARVLAFAPVIAAYWPKENVVLYSFYRVTPTTRVSSSRACRRCSSCGRLVRWPSSTRPDEPCRRGDPSATTGPVRAR